MMLNDTCGKGFQQVGVRSSELGYNSMFFRQGLLSSASKLMQVEFKIDSAVNVPIAIIFVNGTK